MRNHLKTIAAGICVCAFLAFVFWWGGNAPSMRGWKTEATSSLIPSKEQVKVKSEPAMQSENKENKVFEKDKENKESNVIATKENKPQSKDAKPMTPEEKIALAESFLDKAETEESVQNEVFEQTQADDEVVYVFEDESQAEEYTCTLSVRCDTILDNLDWLEEEKLSLIPGDGVIYPEQKVTFSEGESVFDVLVREMKNSKIHLEFVNVPMYKSAYIEGIANVYEFDAGELSGWTYNVNKVFPNYGCSRYKLKPGDKIEWKYTCNLGVDVGGYNKLTKETD